MEENGKNQKLGCWTLQLPEDKKGVSGSTLKWIAIVTMIIDHFGTAVLGRLLWASEAVSLSGGILNVDPEAMKQLGNAVLFLTYYTSRQIGRLAFPIYCFLLVEGLFRSKNIWKYELRLLVFALISEIPFNLAIDSKIFSWTHQNVFFTLAIGLLTIHVMNTIYQKYQNLLLRVVGELAVFAAGALIAEVLHTDYGYRGIVCIVCLYLFAPMKIGQIVAGCFAFLWELTAPLAFIPIAFYNGKRGKQMKYLFYAVYPIHLLILYLVCLIMGLGAYPAL